MREASLLDIDLTKVTIRYHRRYSREALHAMLDVIDCCRYSLLVCRAGGADRTGLAGIFYLMVSRGVPP